jgi:hypothetical protein
MDAATAAKKPLVEYFVLEYGDLSIAELRILKDRLLEKALDIHESMKYVDNDMAEMILEQRQVELMHRIYIINFLLEKRPKEQH